MYQQFEAWITCWMFPFHERRSFWASSSIKLAVAGGNRIFTNLTSLNKLCEFRFLDLSHSRPCSSNRKKIFAGWGERRRYGRRWEWKSGWIMGKMMWRRGHQWPVEDKRIIVFYFYISLDIVYTLALLHSDIMPKWKNWFFRFQDDWLRKEFCWLIWVR